MNDELFTAALGGLLFAVGCIVYLKRKKLLRSGIRVVGTVAGFAPRADADSLPIPLIRYVTADKKILTEQYDVAVSSADKYSEGQKVEVIYDPDDASSFVIDNKTTRYLWLFFMAGGVALFIGAYIYYLLK
ncbi:DUF3592 domain-containing protein [Mucilaginibacter terrenus]|uniref:DUF3592 domain-containing protein n=1 Tax=Mucilaginibacter terrenus TaxID=2482727 RepID=A0A3E2NUF7_9SPHI|nr:DUF3592 domain-containing protein [Mucilaginibacter terrenus]RFZ84561.1 DUF3592 domain-containing protein [Mucilaginibacter terrenus]